MNSNISTQMILTTNFVKYNTLRELISHMFNGSKATDINLYIDLYGVIKTLFSDSYRTDISDYMAPTSTILNMCGHYRSFFKSLGVRTKIFLIFSYNMCEINRKLVADYNEKFYKKLKNTLIKDMVEHNNNLLEVVCTFIPSIYFLKTEFESSVLIDYLISIGDNNPNLIISKDIYPIQLTELQPNTAFIMPRKLNGEDISMCISPKENVNHVDDFWNLYCNRSSTNTSRQSIAIHPSNFILLSSLTKVPERNLNSIINVTTANKIIHEVAGREPIKLSTNSLEFFGGRYSNIPIQLVDSRYKSLDVEFFRNIYKDSVESKMIKLLDLNDPASVNAICAEYFKNNPVDLSRL